RQCGRERVLHGLFGKVKRLRNPDQARDNSPRLPSKDAIDRAANIIHLRLSVLGGVRFRRRLTKWESLQPTRVLRQGLYSPGCNTPRAAPWSPRKARRSPAPCHSAAG